jgi:hypothetical protein
MARAPGAVGERAHAADRRARANDLSAPHDDVSLVLNFRILEFEERAEITMRTAPVHRRFWADVTGTLKVADNGRGGARLLLGVTVHSKPGRITGPTGLYELRKFLFPLG